MNMLQPGISPVRWLRIPIAGPFAPQFSSHPLLNEPEPIAVNLRGDEYTYQILIHPPL